MNKIDTDNKNINYDSIDFLTYNLKSSDDKYFYSILKDFTDCVLNKSKLSIENIILDYCTFLDKSNDNDIIESKDIANDIYIGYFYEEHVLEALYLGVLWKLYIDKVISLDPFYQNILAKLSNLRNNKDISNSPYKTQIDEIRGLLATKFLFNSTKNSCNNEFDNFDFHLKITHLLKYLEATGDYKESLKHLKLWKEFLLSKDEKIAKSYFNTILSFADWFEEIAADELHFFTSNVDDFLNNHLNEHIDKEDILFCGRSELEYHINFLAAEIMNRIFQEKFKNKDRIAILLPTCMKSPNSTECCAFEDNLGFKCSYCNNDCNIGKVAKRLANDSISVYTVSHSSNILSNLSDNDKKELAIVGVACVNNLIEGGWKITSCKIPPQCVILNQVGCKKHWTSEDIQTNFDFDKLDTLLNFKLNL